MELIALASEVSAPDCFATGNKKKKDAIECHVFYEPRFAAAMSVRETPLSPARREEGETEKVRRARGILLRTGGEQAKDTGQEEQTSEENIAREREELREPRKVQTMNVESERLLAWSRSRCAPSSLASTSVPLLSRDCISLFPLPLCSQSLSLRFGCRRVFNAVLRIFCVLSFCLRGVRCEKLSNSLLVSSHVHASQQAEGGQATAADLAVPPTGIA